MMKKVLRLTLFWILTVSIGNILNAQTLQLSGTIKNIKPATEVYLVDFNDQQNRLASTLLNEKDSFSLTAKLDAPSLLIFVVGDKDMVLFVGNEKVNIQGDALMATDQWKVTGSSVHQDYEKYQQVIGRSVNEINTLAQKMNTIIDSNLTNQYHQSLKSINQKIDSFVAALPSSPVSTFATLVSVGLTENVKELEGRYKKLKSKALQNVLGGRLKQVMEEIKYNVIGSKALDFSQKDENGHWVSLSQFKGKYVLIDFWASWCGPCRAENPKLVRLYHQYKNKNFTILGVSLDTEKARWLDAIKRDELTWTQVSDLKGWENTVALQYKIKAIPANILVDPDGKIIAKNLHGDDLKQKLFSILGE